MIGTNTGPFVDISDYPRINDINSLGNLPDPGYPLGPDGRKRKRRLQREQELAQQIDLGVIGVKTSDGKYPYYTQIS